MRKTFFSFHYTRDAWRAGQVRNSNLLATEDRYGFVDSAEWEQIQRNGDAAIERWINEQLKYTSVTVVLIGAQTSERDWVNYEIRQSWKKGNALVGIFIHNIKDQDQKIDIPGLNPFLQIYLADGSPLSNFVKTYDWVNNDGRANLGGWIEDAYQGRVNYRGETQLKEQGQSTPLRSAPTIINNNLPRPHSHD